MKKSISLIIMAVLAIGIFAQHVENVDIWPNGMPNTNGIDTLPFNDAKANFKPEFRTFIPENDTMKRAVIMLPGGGYGHLAMNHEGYDWAPFFNEKNIALFVVKYRMPHANYEVPASDVLEAIRIIRSHAQDWKIDPAKIGIMGFSAGGHLASTIATHYPDLELEYQVLFYPVISMADSITHRGSQVNLLGKNASPELISQFSNDKRVTSKTPKAILILTDDDGAVPPQNSVNYYLGLKKNKVPAVMHIYASGGHGFGIREKFKYHNEMMTALSQWLSELK